ncbi:MAG: HAD hydrolase-like protein, partial [Frankiales bacterium]|nr:HAD hydrolase-like protein [Frankiales bacterium]
MQPVPDRSSNHGFELAVLDIAGTTVEEHGAVYVALEQSVRDAGATPTQEQLHRAMGADKTEAITAMLAPTSNDARVGATYLRFTALLADAYAATPPTPLPGVPEALAALRSAGIKVALTTGFSQDVTATLLAGLGWSVGATVDAVVSAEEVGAGRPAPYMIFEAMRRTGTRDVR